jgi:hypothetical protein
MRVAHCALQRESLGVSHCVIHPILARRDHENGTALIQSGTVLIRGAPHGENLVYYAPVLGSLTANQGAMHSAMHPSFDHAAWFSVERYAPFLMSEWGRYDS